MVRLLRKSLLFVVLSGLLLAGTAAAQTPQPAETAEAIRVALFNAQVAAEAGGAESAVAQAQAAYGGDFAAALEAAAPEVDARIRAGLGDAQAAVMAADAPVLAAARAQVWTAILQGSYQVVLQAISEGEASTARQWLAVREFRPATRFSRPNADATLAVAGLGKGELSAEDVTLAVQADLLDTYQGRLALALSDLEAAEANGFAVRRAEYAALAEGYFAILAPAYAEQRGAAELATAEAAFATLQTAGGSGQGLAEAQAGVAAVLNNFRAAPLSQQEQVRRAGQLLRFLSLVPIEYERGVRSGVVTRDLEIQEAITFRDGAAAAFADLQPLLAAIDPAKTAHVAGRLQSLATSLRETNTRAMVHEPAEIEMVTAEVLTTLEGLMPAEWQQGSSEGDFDVIAAMLDQMEAAVAAGDYELAESARLEAYAILEVGPEARLIAFAPQVIPPLENLFWNGQEENVGLASLLRAQAPLSQVKASRDALDEALANAQEQLVGNSAPAVVVANAGIIVFREGLEAVLILASLMGSFKAVENRRYRRPMWLGAGLAFVASGLTWLLAQELLATLARYGERLEAVVSLIAVGVLLLITNWFFHKVYWTGWMANFHSQKRRMLGAETSLWVGLLALGFSSIYREGFESVLFLQALVLEGGTAVVLGGVALGLAATALVGFLVFALQARLPHRKMLIFTGILIGFVLVVMVGNTIHVWQVVGWLPIHPIRSLVLPYWTGTWLGIYPTWEGILIPLAAAAFVIGSYYLAEYQQKRKRVVGGRPKTVVEAA